MNIEQAKDLLVKTHLGAITRGERANTYELVGKSGTAKSEGVDQGSMRTAQELNQPFGMVTCMAASYLSVDMRGFVFPKTVKGYDWPLALCTLPPWYPTRFNTKVFMPDGTIHEPPLPEDFPIPEFGVLFMDEWGLCDEDIQKAGAPLFLSGGVGDFKLPIHWRVIAASNRLSDRTGVMKPLTLVVNRRGTLPIEASFPPWEKWVDGLSPETRPHPLTTSFAEAHPHIVFDDAPPPANGAAFCTGRSLVKLDRELVALRSAQDIAQDRLPLDNVARQCAAGWIGEAASAQYFTHLKYIDMMPTMKQIVRDPQQAKLPTTKDAQMVCATKCAHQLEEDHVDPVLDYVCRFDKDMQVLWARKVQRHQEKGPWLTVSAKYARWLATNGELLVASHG